MAKKSWKRVCAGHRRGMARAFDGIHKSKIKQHKYKYHLMSWIITNKAHRTLNKKGKKYVWNKTK